MINEQLQTGGANTKPPGWFNLFSASWFADYALSNEELVNLEL